MKKISFIMIVLLLILTPALAGCGGSQAEPPNPEIAVEQLFKATMEMDMDRALNYVSSEYRAQYENDMVDMVEIFEAGGEEAEFLRSIVEPLFGRTSIDTTGHIIEGDNATVDILVEMPDMIQFEDVMMGIMMELMFDEDLLEASEEEIMQLMGQMIGEAIGELDLVQESSRVRLVKEDGEWKVNSDFFSDLFDEIGF